MKKQTTIDLAKFEEAKTTISSIQNQFCGMVIDEIKKNPVFECELIHISAREERYLSTLTVCNITAHLQFFVFMGSNSKTLLGVKLACSSLGLSDVSIKPRNCLELKLDVPEECTSTLLQYKASGGN